MTYFMPVVPLDAAPHIHHMGYWMIQAHLFKDWEDDDERWTWFEDRANFLTLDCGTIELGKPDVDTLYKVAARLNPMEIVCPDAYRDKDKTLKLFHAHAKGLSRYTYRVMVVPQGESVVEWIECLQVMHKSGTFESLPRTTIGVPKHLDACQGGRSAALAWMEGNFPRNYYMQEPTEVHLLGQASTFNLPLMSIGYFPWVRSWDTTWPYACALNNELCADHVKKHVITADQWTIQDYLPKEVILRAEVNIAIVDKAVQMTSAEGKMLGRG